MPKYRVLIQRQYVHEASIDVEAGSVEQAEQIARERIDNTSLRIKHIVDGGDYAEVEYEYKEKIND